MIMKDSKQLGFIHKNNKVVDKIIKNGKILFEQGFTRELTSTTLPLTFNGIGKDLKDYKIYGNIKQSNLPKGYTQVEYIESSGTQYIDTNFIPDNNTSYNIDIELKTLNSLQYFISSHSTNRNNIYMNASSYASAGYGSSYKVTSESLQLNTKYNFSLNKNSFYMNNNLLWEFSEETFTNTANCILFAHNTNGTINNFSAIKLYSCKIYDNNILIRDFIPCYRNSDSEIGLYDLVNNVFYENSGTGNFNYEDVIPTPDNPIKLISCGDKTTNLFDKNNANIYGGYLSGSGIVSGNGISSTDTIVYIECEPNTTYALQKMLQSDTENNRFRIGCTSSIPTEGTQTTEFFKYNDGTLETQYVYTTSETAKYLLFYCGRASSTTTRQQILNSIKIEKGSTVTSYEPYGYKIPINITGSDNLFDVSDIYAKSNGASRDGNYIVFNYNNTTSSAKEIQYNTNNLNLKTNTDYLCVAEIISVSGNGTFRPITHWNAQNQGQFTYDEAGFSFSNLSAGQKIFFIAKTKTSFENITRGLRTLCNFSAGQQGYLKVRISILEDITITEDNFEYQPFNIRTTIFLGSPLRKIGNYSDYIDFINGKIIRNISEVVLNGGESWSKTANTFGNYYYFYSSLLDSTAFKNLTKIMFSDRFNVYEGQLKYNTSVEMDSINISNNDNTQRLRVLLLNTRINNYTTEDFKTWLSQNNITVNYVLVTPIEENIELPNISTINENNILDIETEITPSQVYIKYKSNQ